jgi:CBS domain-containing protein
MTREELEWLVGRLRQRRYPQGAAILAPGEAPGRLHFIWDGTVELEAVGHVDERRRVLAELVQGECFPLEALQEDRTVFSTFRAKVETWCYELPREDFCALQERSAAFRTFCEERSTAFLENSRRVYLAHFARQDEPSLPMGSAVGELARMPPTLGPGALLHDAVRALDADGGELVVVLGEDGMPAGVFTSQDLVHLVAEGGLDLDLPISRVMRAPPPVLGTRDLGQDAALAIAMHGRRHVLVADGGRFVGALTERDLFSLERVGLAEVSRLVRGANDLATLRRATEDVRALARAMMAQGVAAEPFTRILSTLNDGITEKVIALELEAAGVPGDAFCWLALGSEGRFEQTLWSDQDNGLVFDLPPGGDPEAIREAVLPIARRINEALASCGFPLCKGGVMAGNPEWCLSVDEWRWKFAGWIREPTPQGILDATIFFDLRPLWGRRELARGLRSFLAAEVPRHARFLHLLAESALERGVPMGFFRDFVVDAQGTLDLKLSGIAIFVDAARIYGLASGVAATNTDRRLREAGEKLGLPRDEVEAWVGAFHFVQVLRLRLQHALRRAGQEMHNRIDPYALNPLDRRFLLEAFRQANKLQRRVAASYRATSGAM